MAARFVFTEAAETQLLEILDYLAEESESAAVRVRNAIYDAIAKLAENPGIGRTLTTNRPTQDWGIFLGDVPAATAILDRFLAHATIVQMTGKSYPAPNQHRRGLRPWTVPPPWTRRPRPPRSGKRAERVSHTAHRRPRDDRAPIP